MRLFALVFVRTQNIYKLLATCIEQINAEIISLTPDVTSLSLSDGR